MPEFIKATPCDILHGEVAQKPGGDVYDVGIENANNVRMANSGQHDGLPEHFFDFRELHSDSLKNLHGLTAQKPVFNSVHLSKRALPQKPFDLVGVADHFSFL